MTEKQPSLFPEQNSDQVDAQIIPFDQAAAAAHIARNAREVDYEDRTTEAASTQGWGPVDPSELDNLRTLGNSDGDKQAINDTQRRHPTGRRRPAPNTGPVPGESEADTGSPHYHKPFVPIPTEEKIINLEAVRKARKDLDLG